jgi:hypothetical protein
VRECFELMNYRGTMSETVFAFESGIISPGELRRQLPDLALLPQLPQLRQAWIPSGDRARSSPALHERLLDPGMARRRARAQAVYRQVLTAADLTPAPS